MPDVLRFFPYLIATLFFLGGSLAPALDLKTKADGIAVEAAGFGSFTLTYPELRNGSQQPAHKLIEAKADGQKATVRYEDGGEIEVSLNGGTVDFALTKMPADVKSFAMSMLIDIAFSQGGKWKIAGKAEAFPRAKPSAPHLTQGNADSFEFSNAQGLSLAVKVPQYSFQQLTDNREWNWPIFNWMFIVPFNAGDTKATVSFTTGGMAGPTMKLVDALGQTKVEEWPGKMKSTDELASDVKADEAYYASLHPPIFDKYGGLPGSGAELGLKKTGFFHVEQKDKKWWLTDPDGNAFFHFGICGFGPSEDYTYVKGREGIYEWLPKPEGEFKTAFLSTDGNGTESFSFYLANLIRKFGKPYDLDDFVTRTIGRVRQWGFNSTGAFSLPADGALQKASFPYVLSLPANEWEGVPRLPGAFEVWDPFDENTCKLIEQNMAKALPARVNDPLLIGYFIVNEPRYDQLPQAIPALTGKYACRRRFTQMLAEKYKDIAAFNAAWEAQVKSFDELNDAGLAVKTKAAKDDVQAFVGIFLETYFSFIHRLYRQYDANHLLLGCRLQPVTIENEQLCRIAGKYVDVMSYNYYTYGVDAGALKRYYEWTGGRPMIMSEFFWSSPKDSGLTGGREVSSQQERGLAYRNYVEQNAALGFVVGIEWFTLIDQAVTGRWFSRYSGESANTGLFSVTDRPWKPMVEEMMKTNYGIYDLLLGKRPPFKWDDPRFRPKS